MLGFSASFEKIVKVNRPKRSAPSTPLGNGISGVVSMVCAAKKATMPPFSIGLAPVCVWSSVWMARSPASSISCMSDVRSPPAGAVSEPAAGMSPAGIARPLGSVGSSLRSRDWSASAIAAARVTLPELQASTTIHTNAPLSRTASRATPISSSSSAFGMRLACLSHGAEFGRQQDFVEAVGLRLGRQRGLLRTVSGIVQVDEVARLRLVGKLGERRQDLSARRRGVRRRRARRQGW